MTTSAAERRGPGRPMSAEAGDRILDAAVSLVSDSGWAELSMGALAKRAAVGKATIYRRWSSKEEILIAAMERFVDDIRLPDTGAFGSDLAILLDDAIRAYRSPRGRLVQVLASVMEHQPKLAEAIRSKFLEPRRLAVFAIFDRARERGELAADADLDLIFDLLIGPIVYRRLFTGMALDSDLVEGIGQAIVSGFAPQTSEIVLPERSPE